MQAFKRLCLNFPEFENLVQTINKTEVQSATSSPSHIVTHNGHFHCDEAMACALLKILPTYNSMDICRTRDPNLIKNGAIVVDVGAEFSSDNKRFDHHQNSFTETFNKESKIKLSSAGLIYKYFGKDVIKTLYPQLSPSVVDLLYMKMYKSLMREIDGMDNGIEPHVGGEKNYTITTGLSMRVGSLSLSVTDSMSKEEIEKAQNGRFKEAMELTAWVFCEKLNFFVSEWLPARQIVETAFREGGKIICLEKYVPWKAHLLDLEEEHECKGKVEFCLYHDGTIWRVQTVGEEENGFSMRRSLKWKGLRDEELSKASGIENCVFVHASGFIGGNLTREGAFKMAMLSFD